MEREPQPQAGGEGRVGRPGRQQQDERQQVQSARRQAEQPDRAENPPRRANAQHAAQPLAAQDFLVSERRHQQTIQSLAIAFGAKADGGPHGHGQDHGAAHAGADNADPDGRKLG